MTNTQANLTERLRAYKCDRLSSCWFHHPTIADEAANKIERLQARLDQQSGALQSDREAAAAEARRAALRRVAKGLVPLYRKDQVEIARLCDEELDRTGNLLGWLREEAALASPAPQEDGN